MNVNYGLAKGDPDTWMEAQSDERWNVMSERAQRALEINYVPEDEDHYLFESFVEALRIEASKMLHLDLLTGMVEDGLIEHVGVTDEGQILYGITDLGRESIEDLA